MVHRAIILLTVALGLAASRAAMAQYPYLNISTGPTIRFNDAAYGFAGMPNLGLYDIGDTHACAWMENGDELCTYNDGTPPNPVWNLNPSYSNVGIDKMLSGDYRTLTSVNTMPSYGGGGQTDTGGWNDGATWKSSGIAPFSGCVYMTVQRQNSAVQLGFPNGSSAIVKTCDHGGSWSNFWNPLPSLDGNAPPPGHVMWTVGIPWASNNFYGPGSYVLDSRGHNQAAVTGGSSGGYAPNWNDGGGYTPDGSITWIDQGPAVAGFVPVTYCQDNTISCPIVDGNDNYIYLTALGAGAVNQGSYTNYYLARVPKVDFPALDVSRYQYWIGPAGGNIFAPGNWGPSLVEATPLVTVTGMRSQIYYIAGLSQYILINDTAHGTFELWNAPSLAGPWVKSGFIDVSEDFGEFPSINMSSMQTVGSNPPAVTLRIEYGGCSVSAAGDYSHPLDQSYSSHWKYITLAAATSPSAQQNAATFSDNLSRNGLIADLAFFPELGNTITDYSGAGNNGIASQTASPYVGTNYTSHGVWFNALNPGNDVITGGYTVTVPAQINGNAFTMFIAYRKLQVAVPGECLVSGSQISICRNGSNPDDWNVTVNGATSEWNDAANISGRYYGLNYDGSWGMFIVNYTGSSLHVYTNYSLLNGPDVFFPLSGNLNVSNFLLGGNGYSGEISRFVLYNNSLTGSEMIANLQNIDQQLSYRGVYLSRPAAQSEFLLDSQGVPTGAWSVRRLLSNYLGPAMNVYNTTTHAFFDLGFDGTGNLDAADMRAACPTGQTCAVYKWYDQSGNHFDLTTPEFPNHYATLSTCGPNNRPCVKTDGYESYLTPPGFFFYSFTGSVNAVAQVDQANSGSYETYLALIDGITSAANTPALWAPLQGDANNSHLTWIRNYLFPSGVAEGSNTPFIVFSWYDSFYQRFALNGNYLPNLTVNLGSVFLAQARFQAYAFEVGLTGVPAGTRGAAAGYSEITLWDTAFSGGNLQTIGTSQASYYGISSYW